jgi:two-component system, sensor histidine kinase FlrB
MLNLPGTRQTSPTEPQPPSIVDPQSLVQAFEWFTSATASRESSYPVLQAELMPSREDLSINNGDLARSLAEITAMKACLGRILEGLPCGVLLVDSAFRVCFASRAAERLLALGGDLAVRAGAPVPASLRSVLEQIVAEKSETEKTWLQEGPEGCRWIGVTWSALPENTDLGEDFVFTLRDVTEQKRLEEKHEFARRVQALAQMTALLAHEIRNPLGSLELFVGLIKQATLDQPEVAAWVVHVQAGLRALSATVNNVLQFYTQAAPHAVSVEIGKLVASTVEFLQPLALQRSMGVAFVDPGVAVPVNADPHRLQQVFFNLAINAFRAMSAGGMLTVRIRLEQYGTNSSVQIDFEDQGAGIAPKNLGRIFEAGFTTNRGSPGLGLAVCKKVVDEHGGALRVRSEPGKGTIFTLILPAARSADLQVGTCRSEARRYKEIVAGGEA